MVHDYVALCARFLRKRPVLGKGVFIAPGVTLLGSVSIGDNSSVFYGSILRADINNIVVGSKSNIQDNTVIHLSPVYPTIIGSNVTVGHSCLLHGCKVADNCLIGMGAVLLDGCNVGRDSIVGAGALITKGKTFPPRSVIVGSPATCVRNVTDDEVEWIKQQSDNYVKVSRAHAAESQ